MGKKNAKTVDRKAMTPRERCAYSRSPAFRKVQQEGPAWKKITGGLLAVTDGSAKEYVSPGLVFGVELDADGKPVIASYWTEPNQACGIEPPRTLGTCKVMVHRGSMIVRQMPLTYQDMARMVRAVHPLAWVPAEADFMAEYGL